MTNAGPFTHKNINGLIILDIKTEEKAKEPVKANLAVLDGIPENEIRPYNLNLLKT